MTLDTVIAAYVLSTRRVGEINNLVTLLTPSMGVIEAMHYGGAKSRLKSRVCPFNKGKLWLHTDKATTLDATDGRNTLSDFEVVDYHLSFTESLYKSMAATLLGELVIRTNCAGEYKRAWEVFDTALSALELNSEDDACYILLAAIWEYIGLLGLKMDLRHCGLCGRLLDGGAVYCKAVEDGLLCMNCHKRLLGASGAIKVSSSAIQLLGLLETAIAGGLKNLHKIKGIDDKAIMDTKSLLFHILRQAVEGQLRTLQLGIL